MHLKGMVRGVGGGATWYEAADTALTRGVELAQYARLISYYLSRAFLSFHVRSALRTAGWGPARLDLHSPRT